MARYIDIDLLIDKVEETTWYHINKDGELVKGANSETDIPLYMHSDIKRVLDEAPEVDVVPRVEGEWIAKKEIYRTPSAKNYYCSNCKMDTSHLTKYCPNCGAHMKGGE